VVKDHFKVVGRTINGEKLLLNDVRPTKICSLYLLDIFNIKLVICAYITVVTYYSFSTALTLGTGTTF